MTKGWNEAGGPLDKILAIDLEIADAEFTTMAIRMLAHSLIEDDELNILDVIDAISPGAAKDLRIVEWLRGELSKEDADESVRDDSAD